MAVLMILREDQCNSVEWPMSHQPGTMQWTSSSLHLQLIPERRDAAPSTLALQHQYPHKAGRQGR